MATNQDKVRYSDEELQEFKELIEAKIEQAKEAANDYALQNPATPD